MPISISHGVLSGESWQKSLKFAEKHFLRRFKRVSRISPKLDILCYPPPPVSEDGIILRSFVLTQYWRVSVGRTDGRTTDKQKCFKGWVTLRLNFRLKAYVSRQYLWAVRWGNGYTINFGSFHTKKLCNRLYSIEIKFYFKSLFEPLFGGFRVMYALHL